MVYLEKIEWLKERCLNNELVKYYYNYIKGIANDTISVQEKINVKQLALYGYAAQKIDIEKINSILFQNNTVMSGRINTYELLGIYLLDTNNTDIKKDIEEKFIQVDLKLKFIIANIIDSYKYKLLELLKSKQELTPIEQIIKYILDEKFYKIDIEKYAEYIEKAEDFEDLIVLQKFAYKMSLNDINIKSPKDNIISILNNFHNANKVITRDRRKDHIEYIIKDEYDVQDLLSVIFKSIYPKIVPEENTPKVGGTTARADFIFKEFEIVLEIKMIKQKDRDEKDFIEQIKVDILSYYRYKPKYMIFYIYDPFDKTKNEQNFKDLEKKIKYQDRDSNYEIETEIIVIRGH